MVGAGVVPTAPPPLGVGGLASPRVRGDEGGFGRRQSHQPLPSTSEPVGMEIQDFSPSARNDSCSSRLWLFKPPPPLPSPYQGEGHLAVGNSRPTPFPSAASPVSVIVSFLWPLHRRALAPPESGERRG